MNLVQPDLAVWLAGLDLHAQPSPPPDLAVEILSPATRRRDVEQKRRLYARAAVPELWLVDPEARAVTALREPSAGEYATIATTKAEEALTSGLLPELAVPVGTLFA